MIVWWIALACSGGVSDLEVQTPSVVTQAAPLNDGEQRTDCVTPDVLPALSGEWRWATASDFHPNVSKLESEIRVLRGEGKATPSMTCVYGQADFNDDQAEDVVGLVVHHTTGDGRLVVGLSGEATVRVLAEFSALETGGMYTSFQIKAAGKDGVLSRDSPSTAMSGNNEVEDRLKGRAGVSVCRPMNSDDAGRPLTLDTDNICFCTEQFYFAKPGGFHSVKACD